MSTPSGELGTRPGHPGHELGNHETKRDEGIKKLRVTCMEVDVLTSVASRLATGQKSMASTFLLACFAASLFGQIARAQDDVFFGNPPPSATVQKKDPAPKPTPPQSPTGIRIGSITFSGSVRARVENWNWFETSLAEPDYTFGAIVLRTSLSQQKKHFDWQIEGAFPLLINLPKNSIAPAPQGQLGLGGSYYAASGNQDASANLKQAYLRLKGLFGDEPGSLRFGRFEFIEGAETTPTDPTLATLKRDHIAHRLIGPFTFSHVGRSSDGIQYNRTGGTTNVTALGARPTEGVFQLNANRELDIDFYYIALTKLLTGRQTTNDSRVFALHYHDGRSVLKTDNRPEDARRADDENIRLTVIGGHWISAINAGAVTVDMLLWGVGQFGRWGRLDHRAGAVAIEGGFQFPVKFNPWIRAGYFRGSGDNNPADARHNTFFQVLPTPRVYARFPFYNS